MYRGCEVQYVCGGGVWFVKGLPRREICITQSHTSRRRICIAVCYIHKHISFHFLINVLLKMFSCISLFLGTYRMWWYKVYHVLEDDMLCPYRIALEGPLLCPPSTGNRDPLLDQPLSTRVPPEVDRAPLNCSWFTSHFDGACIVPEQEVEQALWHQ